MKRFVTRVPDRDFVAFMRDNAGIDLSNQPLDDPRLWFTVSVRDDNTGEMVGGLAVEFLHNFDAYFSAAVIDPEVLTRRLLRAIFSTLFTRVTRLTATVDPENYPSKEGLRRLGFVFEGFLRRGLDGVRDAELYGMLLEDCKFLPGYAGGTVTPATVTNTNVVRH